MRTSKQTSICVVAIVLLAAAATASADPIYSNFGPGDTWNTSYGLAIRGPAHPDGTSVFGMDFTTPGIPYYLDTVEVPLSAASATTVYVNLWTSNGLIPAGRVLETAVVNGVLGPSTLYTATFDGTTMLDANTEYWIVLTAAGSGFAGWNRNNTGDLGWAGHSGGPWTISPESPASAYRVSGTPVPEPASVLLLGVGVACLAGWRRKARARK